MRKGTTILAIQVTDEELAAFDAEAKAPPFYGNRSKYGHSILMGRHQMTIVAAPHLQPLLDQHAQELEQLRQQQQEQLRQQQLTADNQTHQLQATLNQLQRELKTSQQNLQARQQDLRGCQGAYDQLLETASRLQEQQRKQLAQTQSAAFKEEQYQDQLTTLGQQLRESQSQLEKEKADHRQLGIQLRQAQRTIGLVEETAPRLEALAAQAAQASQAKGTANAVQQLLSEWQAATVRKDTQLGQALLRVFKDEALSQVLAVLVYFGAQPQAAGSVLASKGYVAYQARQGSASSGSARGPA